MLYLKNQVIEKWRMNQDCSHSALKIFLQLCNMQHRIPKPFVALSLSRCLHYNTSSHVKNPNLNVDYATADIKALNNGNIHTHIHTLATFLAKISEAEIQVYLISYGFKASLTVTCD